VTDRSRLSRLMVRALEGATEAERQRVLAILAAVAEQHYSAPARHVLREIERRVRDVPPRDAPMWAQIRRLHADRAQDAAVDGLLCRLRRWWRRWC
jgi:hypothetical protein